jgi:uncharacterized DUF497 family protein
VFRRRDLAFNEVTRVAWIAKELVAQESTNADGKKRKPIQG